MTRKSTTRLPAGVTLKNGRYYRPRYRGLVDGKRRYEWIPLSREAEGLAALYAALARLEGETGRRKDALPDAVDDWLKTALPGLSAAEQIDTARMAQIIRAAFGDFRVEQVQARDCLDFLNQWSLAGKLRTAQRYRATLVKFFRWTIIMGLRQDNPVDPIRLKAPRARQRYITDAEFAAIRAALLGDPGHAAASGPMAQVYVDLLYLTGQRGTDIRLLRWSQVDDTAGVIHFTPSKTEHSSGAKVDVAITPAIAETLARARQLARARARISPYVIHNLDGDAYTAHGIGTAWERARKRAGIEDATLKDIRAKHGTDAKKLGHSIEEIQDALAHEDQGTTRIYLKQREVKKGRIALTLPTMKKAG